MKIDWLDKLVEHGYVSEKMASKIYADCEQLIKQANVEGEAQKLLKFPVDATRLMEDVTSGAIGALGTLFLQGIWGKIQQINIKDDIEKNRSALLKELTGDPEKIKARFDEIAVLAPHVAANKNLVKKMIEDKIESGLTSQDANSLALIQSQYTNTLGKQRSFQPKLAGEIAADTYILMSKTGTFKKMAQVGAALKGKGDFWRYVGALGLATSIPTAIGVGIGAAKHLYSKFEEKKVKDQLEESFQKAIALSDENKEPLKADKAKARQAFQALAHFAPNVALQPQAARAFMSKMVSYDLGLLTSDLKDLTDIERNISGARRPSAFSEGFAGTTRALNLGGMAQKGIEGFIGPTPEEIGEAKARMEMAKADYRVEA
jgi:hypothetical protein